MSSTNIQCIQWGINPPTESSLLQLLKEVVSNGASFTAIDKWYFFGKHLCPYCIRLYNGIWDHKAYKFRALRYLHDRCVCGLSLPYKTAYWGPPVHPYRYGSLHGPWHIDRKDRVQTVEECDTNRRPDNRHRRFHVPGIWNDVYIQGERTRISPDDRLDGKVFPL